MMCYLQTGQKEIKPWFKVKIWMWHPAPEKRLVTPTAYCLLRTTVLYSHSADALRTIKNKQLLN